MNGDVNFFCDVHEKKLIEKVVERTAIASS